MATPNSTTMNPQKKSIPKSNQTNSKMPYPIPLSMGHNNQKKKKTQPRTQRRWSTEKTRSLALATMVRERGLVKWLVVGPVTVAPTMVAWWWRSCPPWFWVWRGENKQERRRQERGKWKNEKGRERRIRDNIIIIFNYTILLQYHPSCSSIVNFFCNWHILQVRLEQYFKAVMVNYINIYNIPFGLRLL